MNDLVKVDTTKIEKTGAEQLLQVAQMLADSKMFVHPKDKAPLKPGEVFCIIEYGREIGLEPVMALQNINIVNGRLCTGGGVMLGLAMQHGITYNVEEETMEKCKITFKREGFSDYTAEFTMDDAKRIVTNSYKGTTLADKDVWKNYPQEMLKWRTVAKGLRVIASDILAGLYLPEEIESIAEADLTYTPANGDEYEPKAETETSSSFLGDAIIPEALNTDATGMPTDTKVELITDNQIRALNAVMTEWQMQPYRDVFKDHLREMQVIDESLSTKSITKETAKEMLADFKKCFATFLLQEHLYPRIKEIFANATMKHKKDFFDKINQVLHQPVDYKLAENEQMLVDYLGVACLALQSQYNNEIAQQVYDGELSTEEAIEKLEDLGMQPKVEEVIEVQPEPEPFF